MLNALSKAIEQTVSDPKLRAIMIKGVIGAVFIFIALWIVAGFGLSTIVWRDIPVIGGTIGWVADFNWIVNILGIISFLSFYGIVLTASFMLLLTIMTLVISIFLNDVCEAVEAKYYPNAGPILNQSLRDSAFNAVKFLGITIGLNILALPIYLFAWWFFGLGIIAFYVINGYLVGREYFELVAHRHMDAASTAELRRANRGYIMLAGFIIVFAMTIPLVNLLTPILAVAMMVHIFMELLKAIEFSKNINMKADVPSE